MMVGTVPEFYANGFSKIAKQEEEMLNIEVEVTLWKELAAYLRMPTCLCEAAKALQIEKEEECLQQFLYGLRSSYDSLHDQPLNIEPLPTVNKVYSLLICGQKQRAITGVRILQLEGAALVDLSTDG